MNAIGGVLLLILAVIFLFVAPPLAGGCVVGALVAFGRALKD